MLMDVLSSRVKYWIVLAWRTINQLTLEAIAISISVGRTPTRGDSNLLIATFHINQIGDH